MKYFRGIFLTVSLCFGLVPLGWAQEDSQQLTIKEQQESKRLLALFARRLDETMDVEQALQAVSVPDWFDRILRRTKKAEADEPFILGAAPSLLVQHEGEYRRAVLAFFNVSHLMLVYSATQPTDADEEPDYLNSLPPEAYQILRSNRWWAAQLQELNGETSDEEAFKIETLVALQELSWTSERIADILRMRLQSLDAQGKRLLRQQMTKNKREMNSEPHLHICNEECGGLPDGTRTVLVDYLLFQLTFAQVGKEMKLVLVASRIGE